MENKTLTNLRIAAESWAYTQEKKDKFIRYILSQIREAGSPCNVKATQSASPFQPHIREAESWLGIKFIRVGESG